MSNRVSVIMGIYNCADTLSEAIDSILNQTFEDWKLIMCDDGSIDSTYEIAQSYKNRYPDKIVLLKNKKNIGLNSTLNRCLQQVETEYVARMDGDDISLINRFQEEVSFLDSNPSFSIVSTPMIYFDDEGEWKRGRGTGEVNVNDVAKGTPFCHAPCMVRKGAYDSVGGYSEDKKWLRVEDYNLWVKMLAKGYKGYVLENPLYMMRDDRNAKKRRKYKYRINEARVKKMAIKELKLNKKNYVYACVPLVVGIMPAFVYNYLHKHKKRG